MAAETTRTSSEVRKENRRRKLDRYRIYPELTYHYGLSFDEIWSMPPGVREIYHEALPRLVALEQLRRLQASAFPQMKKSARSKVTRTLERQAKPREDEEETQVSKDTEEAAADLGQMQIGVQFVDAEGKPIEQPEEKPESVIEQAEKKMAEIDAEEVSEDAT